MKTYKLFFMGWMISMTFGCSSTPRLAYDRSFMQPQASFSQGTSTHRNGVIETQPASWSVISDPVVLDTDPNRADQSGTQTEVSVQDAQIVYYDLDTYLYSPGPEEWTIDTISSYPQYYQTDGYLPSSYFSYGYYSPYNPRYSWWYYDDLDNAYLGYRGYPYGWNGSYYGYGMYPYSSSVVVYNDYPYSAIYYSGYYPASFWSPLDYYNPYWAYGWHDYWRGYYAGPYLYRYGYSPLYSYYDPWFGRPYWYPHYRPYHDKDTPKEEDRTQREPRPMLENRREQIRISNNLDESLQIENRFNSRLEGKSPRLSTSSNLRDQSANPNRRFDQRSISRQIAPSAPVWPVPALSSSNTNTAGTPLPRTSNASRTLRLSREQTTPDSNSSSITRESQRPVETNASGWTSESSDSRVSLWKRQRDDTKPSSPASRQNPIVINPGSRQTHRQIEIIPPDRRRESVSPSLSNAVDRSTERLGGNAFSLPSRAFSQPAPRQAMPRTEPSSAFTPARSQSLPRTEPVTTSPNRSVSIPESRSSFRSDTPSRSNSTPSLNSRTISPSPSRSSSISEPRGTFSDAPSHVSPSRSDPSPIAPASPRGTSAPR